MIVGARVVPVVAGAMLLVGCTLVDQQTFNPRAAEAPVIPEAPKPVPPPLLVGPPPLVTIPAGATGFEGALRGAVAAARTRKPTVLFDVVEMQKPDIPVNDSLGSAAATAARVIVAEGVPAPRVRLAVRPEAGAAPGEVRIYVQ